MSGAFGRQDDRLCKPMPMNRQLCAITFAVLALAGPTRADEDRDAFIEANVLAIFYHELGHAVIDLLDVPIFGQEEDAADVIAVLMIDRFFEEDAAQAIAYDSAFGYLNDPDRTEEVAYWDTHGPDEQRYYNHVCLFYGAAPDVREQLAVDLGLPEERADTCPEEYDLAAESWAGIFDEMHEPDGSVPMQFMPGSGDDAELPNRVLQAEVSNINSDLHLPYEVIVHVDDCGEPNAFYDPNDVTITFCTEFVLHLAFIYDSVFEE